ncbi:MAG TPA: capsule biosynthesis protein CapA [Lachnospiraceae bacterium]|nr:capsule biosynthesis protein CapA [Lachnospiraceae bacterium]
MKAKIRISILFALCITAFGLCGCEAGKAEASNMTKIQLEYELSKYDSSYEKILAVCTKEFAGNHPIDENFMGWFISRYGDAALDTIVAKEEFVDPDIWYNITGKSIHVLWYEYSAETGLDTYNNLRTHVVNTKSVDNVVFDIAGDVSLAEGKATTNYMYDQKNGLIDCFDDNMLDAINDSDIFIVNNEFAYTTRGDAIVEKYYTFRGNPDLINELKHIGVDAVTIANNHVYDYREEGFLDTLRSLEDYKMPYVGAGRNLEDAKQPIYYIANGRKIAIVNATQIEKNQNFTKEATEDEAGVLKCLEPEEFIDEIEKAKKNSDYVLCISHWGTEYQAKYGKDQEKLAKQFAEAGADVIIGGHPHVLQGVDYIDDVPVYYSLGNFFFSLDEKMPESFETGLAKISINRDGDIKASFIPCRFDDGVISLVVDNKEAQKIYSELNRVSGDARLDNNGLIIKK